MWRCRHGDEWCGSCYERATRGGETLGTARLRAGSVTTVSLWEYRSMKRPDSQERGGGDGLRLVPDSFGGRCCLCEYMTAGAWDDGQPRETSTLMVVAEEGLIKCCLNDRALGRSLWRSGATMDAALDALEAALVDPRADWRRRAPAPRGKR